jgi:molybdopterin converting factor small subunit
MNITVISYNELKPFTDGLPEGGRLALADGETVGGVLRRLAVPPQKRMELVLFVNGRMARPETRLIDGDTLVFFSAIAGG